jgi:hypothetical protein
LRTIETVAEVVSRDYSNLDPIKGMAQIRDAARAAIRKAEGKA